MSIPAADPGQAETVILLHGLWMRRPAMWLLARRLHAAGFEPRLFPYGSLRDTPEETLRRLATWVREAGSATVHLVGHSLGGMTALALLCREADLPPGRVVCLGSPLRGSRAARRIEQLRVPWLVGNSLPLLLQGVAIPAGRQVGMIAGTRGMGGGRWVTRFEGPSDGSVAVEETRVDGLADHHCLPVSHSGLMLSAAVAHAVAEFLRSGRFPA